MLSPRFQTTRCPDMAQDPVRPRDSISSADSKRAQSGAPLQAGDIPHTATEEPAQSKVSLLVVAVMGLVPSFLRAQSWSLLGYAEADRRAFAISRATFSPFKTLEQLPSLALSQESDRKEVAKILLKKIPEEVFISLRRIGIQDKEFTFEVAHAAVNSSVTSLYYPWWRSNKKLPERVGQLNLSDEERFAILATVLDRRSHELPVYGRTLRPALPEIRFKFACMWAESKAEIQSIGGSPEALFPLSKAWLPDEHMRADVLRIAVSKAPHLIERFVQVGSLTSPSLVREVALKAASSPGDFDYQALRGMGIRDEKSLQDILENGVRANPLRAVSQLKFFAISDKAFIHRIIQEAADSFLHRPVDLQCFVQRVSELGIDDGAVLRRVAGSLARFGWMNAAQLAALGVSTREEKLAFAALAAHSVGPPPSSKLANLGLSDQMDVMRIMTWASARHPLPVVWKLQQDYPNLEVVYRLAVYKTMIGQSKDGVSALLSSRAVSAQSIVSDIVIPALHTAQEMWGQSREVYAVKVIETILHGMLRNAAALGLDPPESPHEIAPLSRIAHALRTLETKFPNIQLGVRTPNIDPDALSIDAALLVSAAQVATAPISNEGDAAHRPLALLAGLDGLANEPLGQREYRRIVELLRSIYEGHAESHPNLGTLVDISPEVWKRDFSGVFECLVSRAALYSIDLSILPECLTIRSDTIDEQRRIIGTSLNNALAARLELSSGAGAVEIAQRWGDLTPITVLLGRFARSHPYEIPALREVVDHVIQGTFFQYRYDLERGQLGGFTPAMVERWRENPHRLAFCRAGESSELSNDRALAGAQRNYEQLLAHVSGIANVGDVAEGCSLEDARSLARCKQDVFAEYYRTIEKKRPGGSLPHIIGSVGELLREGDREGVALFLRNFATIKSRVASHLPQEIRLQLLADLNAIAEVVKERTVDKSKGYVVFTTLTDDPKLMLMVGDLVNTSSCQNFRTGSVVETLLGYVMDGNIKAVLSFAIAEGNLRNLFTIPHNQLFDPSRYTVNFDAPKLLLTLTDPEGQSRTVSLGKAIRRRILRVGQREEDAQPAMFAERPYEILHAVTAKIEAEEELLLHSVEKSCGFRPAVGNVEFPASSNPFGVYSDHGQGVMIGEYLLKVT